MADQAEDEQPDVAERLAELSRLLLTEAGLDGALEQVGDIAVAVVPSCAGCGVSVVAGDRVITRMATSQAARDLDEVQYQADDGPCLTAIRTEEIVALDSIAEDLRWPAFVRVAHDVGMISSYSLPLAVDAKVVGALNLYSASRPFLRADRRRAEELATHAAVTLANARAYQQVQALVGQLRQALESRDVIGQAKGIIMERERVSAGEAFEILSAASQRRNIKLRDLAALVAETGTLEASA